MNPTVYGDGAVYLYEGDCIQTMRSFPDASVDAIVTDPPYGLGFMGKEWDDLPPGEEWARECLRVLKPGGHLLAFGGSRTWHRLAVSVEDAGFEIRDSLAWLYGSGFPKSDHALKPSFEPIVVGRRPVEGSAKANEQKYGTGKLQVDACRIGDDVRVFPAREDVRAGSQSIGAFSAHVPEKTVVGRWPTNVLLATDAAEEAGGKVADLFPTFPATPGTGADDAETSPPTAPAAVDAATFLYCAKAPTRERVKVDGVAHPTVKPLALMQWLLKLVTPPGGTVLEPFAGSGTTLEAAALEGIRIVGIEREASYLPLIDARMARVGLTTAGEAAA